ncbi:MAG: A24 family peptidase [Planctomycetota bacterium]
MFDVLTQIPLSAVLTGMESELTEPQNAIRVVALLPLFGFLVVAAVWDWKTRKIPNLVTFPMLLAGLAKAAVAPHLLDGVLPEVSGLSIALLGVLAGFGAGVPLMVLGARGGGDAKLYMAAGAWVGPMGVVYLFAIEAIIGAVMVLAQAARTGRLKKLLRNTGVLTMNLLHVRRLGTQHVAETGQKITVFESVDKKLPHAVPFLAAALIAVGWGYI